jgi:hypothetical protein
LALAALGGCQSTPSTPSATTPTPGPDTPHETLRIRPVLVDQPLTPASHAQRHTEMHFPFGHPWERRNDRSA